MPGLGELGHGDIRAINRQILGIIQIESPSAVDTAAEIAAIDGVDVLFVGPTDLSQASASRASSPIRPMSRRSHRSCAAADGAGKTAGILLRDASTVARHRDLGFRFIGLGSDGAFVADGARAVLREAGRT